MSNQHRSVCRTDLTPRRPLSLSCFAQLTITLEDGAELVVDVPEGVGPGDEFEVQPYAPGDESSIVVEEEEEEEEGQ